MDKRTEELLKCFEERTNNKKTEEVVEETVEEDDSTYLQYKGMPVALGKLEGVDYIFCVVEDGVISFPLYYGEITEQASIEETGRSLRIGMNKVYMALDLMENVYVDFQFLYPLNKTKENDCKLYDMYVRIIEEIRMSESGLIKPSTQDLVNLNSGK